MRKIFTLIAMAAFAVTVSAQKIEFTQKYEKLNVPGTFEKDGFVLTVTDTDDSGKISVDGNTAYFGTADNYVSFSYRLKTGGKSSSKNALSLTLPQDGTIKIYARTGSNSATDRNVILTQKESSVELLNKVLLESEAVETVIDGDVKKVYPVLSASAKAGVVDITYPVNSINFYCFELVTSTGVSQILTPEGEGETYNLSGVKVADDTKGIVIKNGKKVVNGK